MAHTIWIVARLGGEPINGVQLVQNMTIANVKNLCLNIRIVSNGF
jgi:hypothetical protein